MKKNDNEKCQFVIDASSRSKHIRPLNELIMVKNYDLVMPSLRCVINKKASDDLDHYMFFVRYDDLVLSIQIDLTGLRWEKSYREINAFANDLKNNLPILIEEMQTDWINYV